MTMEYPMKKRTTRDVILHGIKSSPHSTVEELAEVADVSPVTVVATVVAVSRSEDGQFALVDLLVSSDAAPDLAARAATGKVAVVLDSRER